MSSSNSGAPYTRREFLKIAGIGGASLAAIPGLVWSRAALAKGAGKTLSIGRNQDNTTLDPILTIENADIWSMDNMNANLVRVTHDGKGLEPDLAESWEALDGGHRYRFKLRDGLKFSNGAPILPTDVKFSLERLRDQKNSVMGSMYQIIKEIHTPDKQHVEVVLSEVSAPFLSTMAMFSASILPANVVKSRGDGFGTNPVGAGAFKLEKWTRQNRLTLVKNEHYWQSDKVSLEKIEWVYIPNDNTRLLNLQSGQTDAAIFIPFNRIDGLKRNANIKVDLDPSSREDFMIINHAKKPLDDVRVRRALYMGANREAIVKVALFGHGKVSNSFIPAGALYHNPDNKDYPYDPKKAKALLAEAGVSSLSLNLLIASGNSVDNQVAVVLQNMYHQIGINLNITKQEEGQQWQSLQAGNYDLALNYWTNDIIDPDEKATFCLYGYDDNRSYFTNYKSPKAKKLILEGRHTLDDKKRRKIYYELQQLAVEDVVYVNLYYSPFRNASLDEVKDFYQNPTGRFMLESTSIESGQS